MSASQSFPWDDIRLVAAIAAAGGLGGAAERLGINHSTAFRRLGQIEAALGVPLFERHRGGYAATQAGQELVEIAGRMEEEVTGFTRRLAGDAPEPVGELRLTTNDALLLHLLTPLLAEFLRRYPGIRLDIVLSNDALNLARRDADVALRASANPPDTLVGRRLADIGWALYGRADAAGSPGSDKDALLRQDLLRQDWVAPGRELEGIAAGRFVHAKVDPERIVYRVNTVVGLVEAIEAGIGIGPLPCYIGDKRPGLMRLAPPEPDWATSLWLLTHADLRRSARVRVLLDFLASEIGRMRATFAG